MEGRCVCERIPRPQCQISQGIAVTEQQARLTYCGIPYIHLEPRKHYTAQLRNTGRSHRSAHYAES